MRTFNLNPGDVLAIRCKDGSVAEMFLEDGPFYGEEVFPWITIANEGGEISTAVWDKEYQGWVEQR